MSDRGWTPLREPDRMERKRTTSVAKVIEIGAESSQSFEDAIRHGIGKAAETVHEIRSVGRGAAFVLD